MSFMKFKPFVGPKIFQFQDPDTGRPLKAETYEGLVKLIVSYRHQNGLEPIEHLNIVIDNYLCTLPCHVGDCVPRVKLKRNFTQYIKGGIALVKDILYKKRVSRAVAEKRADICIDCPHNVFPDKGAFLTWSDRQWESMVGDTKVKQHDELGNCEICSCPLRAKVWYDGDMELEEDHKKIMKEVGCWQVDS